MHRKWNPFLSKMVYKRVSCWSWGWNLPNNNFLGHPPTPCPLTCQQFAGAPDGSVPQNVCSSGTFLLAGRCGRNNSPWKESVAGKKIIQGVRGDLKSRIAATGYLYGLLTTQDLNCALWNFPVSQVAGCKVAGWELFHQSCWEWGTDNFFPAISQNA